jgi:hypothetical protein
MNSVRCETRRTFRNKEREYLKEKVDELETNCVCVCVCRA